MYEKHKMDAISFENNSVWAGVEGPTLSVGDGRKNWDDQTLRMAITNYVSET